MRELRAKVGRLRRVASLEDSAPLTDDSTEAESATSAADLEVVIDAVDDDGDSAYRISSDNPRFGMWAEYLKAQEGSETPVHLKVDEESKVHEVLPTYRYVVESVEVVDDGSGREARIFFRQSPALHILSGNHSKFEEFRALLQDAAQTKKEVLVTRLLTSPKIVDARLAPEAPSAPGVSNGPLLETELLPLDDTEPLDDLTELTPDSFATQLTISQAIEAFDLLATHLPLQIPFKSPEDGCMERAHLMCHILREERGIRARKVWNYGSGYTLDPRRATLEFFPGRQIFSAVRWTYHVAPIVSVQASTDKLLVLDPAMFPEWPVPLEKWLRAQYDSSTKPFGSSDLALFRLLNGAQEPGDLNEVNKNLAKRALSWREKRMEFLFPQLPPS